MWRERNSRVARTPNLVCHSVRQSAYSEAQTQVAYSICANESIYTHTNASARAEHTLSQPINVSWKLEISLFILCHSLIRFHHHSNAFPLHIFLSLVLPHSHSVPHCSTADLLAVSLATAASCLSVCVAMEEG